MILWRIPRHFTIQRFNFQICWRRFFISFTSFLQTKFVSKIEMITSCNKTGNLFFEFEKVSSSFHFFVSVEIAIYFFRSYSLFFFFLLLSFFASCSNYNCKHFKFKCSLKRWVWVNAIQVTVLQVISSMNILADLHMVS